MRLPKNSIRSIEHLCYQDILQHARRAFPSPTPDRTKDAYFAQIINKSLSSLDKFKSTMPFLGEREPLNYEGVLESKILDSISTIETIISFNHINFINLPLQIRE